PFAKATINDSLISLDVFLALCAVTGMVLGTTLHAQVTTAPPRLEPASAHIPTVILLGCLSCSVLAWHLIARDTERRAADRFTTLVASVKEEIVDRMSVYQEALLGGRGLFYASKTVERDEWRRYVGSLA